MAAGVIGLGMAAVLGYRAARWLKAKYRWWMAPAGAAAAGYVFDYTYERNNTFLLGAINWYVQN